MDWGMMLTSVVISLVLTVFGYLFVPIILALSGKRYAAKKLKRINILNCVVVWILFRVLQLALGNEMSSGAAVFIWGGVGHWILKKNCLEGNKPVRQEGIQPCSAVGEDSRLCGSYETIGEDLMLKCDTEFSVTAEAKTMPKSQKKTTKKKKYCSYCGQIIDPISKKCTGCGKQYFKGISVKRVFTILIGLMFIVSLMANLVLFLTTARDKERILSLEKENAALKDENKKYLQKLSDLDWAITKHELLIDSLEEEIAFYDENVVFVADDGTKIYHNYDCQEFQLCTSFWAYNTEAAKSEGYKPCPNCCE